VSVATLSAAKKPRALRRPPPPDDQIVVRYVPMPHSGDPERPTPEEARARVSVFAMLRLGGFYEHFPNARNENEPPAYYYDFREKETSHAQ
jgi:hypothetical protein